MHEVKFRGKRTDDGGWVHGHLHVIDTCGEGYTGKAIQVQYGKSRPFSVQIDESTIGKYAGLKDMNSKEIYTRDIVLREGKKYHIAFEIGSFMLVKIDEENTDMYEEFTDCWNDHVYPLSQLYWNNNDAENHLSDLEVIGNITDNPELLEVK